MKALPSILRATGGKEAAMTVTLEEMKNYLRVDFDADDALIESLITAAEKTCMDILRTDDPAILAETQNGIYEHREEADHHALNLTLRAMLFGSREAKF